MSRLLSDSCGLRPRFVLELARIAQLRPVLRGDHRRVLTFAGPQGSTGGLPVASFGDEEGQDEVAFQLGVARPDGLDACLLQAAGPALKGLAHELRNPLAGIKGAAQLLARRTHEDPTARELTGLIEAEVGRLATLLDRLLSPTPARPFEALNIHAVLERVLRLAENDAGWAVKLLRDYDPSLPELDGDADRLTQATWNLVRNAIEAGAANVTLRTRAEHGVRIGDAAPATALRLEIVDDGRGVPEDLAERLFLPLVSGRAEGSGLGLALAQQVAREHRGSLAYRSRAGHTVFTLLLPLQVEGTEHA